MTLSTPLQVRVIGVSTIVVQAVKKRRRTGLAVARRTIAVLREGDTLQSDCWDSLAVVLFRLRPHGN